MARTSQEQFNDRAASYAASQVHRAGPSLPVLLDYSAPGPDDVALDVATGTGNVVFALAPSVKRAIGLDVAAKMLAQARAESVPNADWVLGSAEAMPVRSASMDLVTARHAPHHFRDLPAFLAEARRVLKPGGRFVLADQISPSPKVRAWVDEFQTTRDPSHFAQRTPDEWRVLAAEAGLNIVREEIVPYRLVFENWTATSGTPPQAVDRLLWMASEAPDEIRQGVGLEFDASGRLLSHREPMLVARFELAD